MGLGRWLPELTRGERTAADALSSFLVFRALPPPQQCSKLAAAYGQALTSYVAVMNNIQVAMKTGDLSALLQMRGGAQGNVDRMLKLSDSELEAVCKTYDITKQFDIVTDSDVGSILGF